MRIGWAVVTWLLVAPTVSADWLMEGGDAARTGDVGAVGPAWADVALRVETPLERWGALENFQPLIIGDHVYATAFLGSNVVTDEGTTILHDLDTRSGELRTVATIEHFAANLGSDGRRIFYSGPGMVGAVDLAEGTSIEAPFSPSRSAGAASRVGGLCASPVVTDSALYFGCYDIESTDFIVQGFDLDLNPGIRWTGRLAPRQPAPPSDPQDPTPVFDEASQAVNANPMAFVPFVATPTLSGIALVDDALLFSIGQESLDAAPDTSTSSVVAIRVGDGSTAWSSDLGAVNAGANAALGGDSRVIPSLATGVAGSVFFKQGPLYRQRLTEFDWRGQTNYPLDEGPDEGSGLAMHGGDLFVAGARQLHRLTTDFEQRWLYEAPDPGFVFERGGLVVTDACVFAKGRLAAQTAALLCIDPATGRERWRHILQVDPVTQGSPNSFGFAVANGLVAIQTNRGELVVLGDLPSSLRLPPVQASAYPPVDAIVTVDLSGATGGLTLDGLEWSADWGDGTSTDWQAAPVLEHAYAAGQKTEARFFVRNAAGQTGSAPFTFYVGQHDPAVTILNSPFANEYQETTFFILGLVATAIVAGVGLWRAGRKRRRLHRELRELEADFARLEADSKACDAMLSKRKALARSLFLERRLEEAHASFLAGRVDELRRGLRLGAVDARLKFLPHGMVLQLQRLLADARVDEYERDHLMAALDQETSLTPGQKDEVRRVIDGWYARDADGAR